MGDHLAEAHNTGQKHECSICHKKLRTESYVKIHRQAHYTNSPTKDGVSPMKRIPHIETLGQIMINEEEAEVPAPQEEEIVLNGEPVSASEDTEGTEDEATMTPDSHEAMTPESEAVATPESHDPEVTPDRECFLDPEDREMMGGYQQQILV